MIMNIELLSIDSSYVSINWLLYYIAEFLCKSPICICQEMAKKFVYSLPAKLSGAHLFTT